MALSAEQRAPPVQPLPGWLPVVLLLLPLIIVGPFTIPHLLDQARYDTGLGFITEPDQPAKITYVEPGTLADDRGIVAGDTVVAFNGNPVTSMSQLNHLWSAQHGDAFELTLSTVEGQTRHIRLHPGKVVDFTGFTVRLLGAYYFIGLILLLLPQWRTTEGRILILLLAVLSTDFLLPYSQVDSRAANAALWRFNMWGISLALVLKLHFILLFPRPAVLLQRHGNAALVLLYGLMLPGGILLSMQVDNTLDPQSTQPFFRADLVASLLIWSVLTGRWLMARQHDRRLLRTVWLFYTPHTLSALLWHLHVYHIDLPWLEWYTWTEPLLLALLPTGIFLAITRHNYLQMGKRLDSRLLRRFLMGMGFLFILALGQQLHAQQLRTGLGGLAMLLVTVPVMAASTLLLPASKKLAYWMERGIFEPLSSLHQRFRNHWLNVLPEDASPAYQLKSFTRFIRTQLQLPWVAVYWAGSRSTPKPRLFIHESRLTPDGERAE